MIQTIGNPWLWGGFVAVVIAALLIDLVLMRHGGPHKVSFKEAMAYDQAQQTGSESSSRSGELSEASQQEEFAVMLRMMPLAQSYGVFGQETEQASSVSAVA